MFTKDDKKPNLIKLKIFFNSKVHNYRWRTVFVIPAVTYTAVAILFLIIGRYL